MRTNMCIKFLSLVLIIAPSIHADFAANVEIIGGAAVMGAGVGTVVKKTLPVHASVKCIDTARTKIEESRTRAVTILSSHCTSSNPAMTDYFVNQTHAYITARMEACAVEMEHAMRATHTMPDRESIGKLGAGLADSVCERLAEGGYLPANKRATVQAGLTTAYTDWLLQTAQLSACEIWQENYKSLVIRASSAAILLGTWLAMHGLSSPGN